MNNKGNHTFQVNGEELVKKVKELLHEGNIRKIIIKDEKAEKTFIEIPVTIGVIGTLFAPVLAALGALAAMVGFVTVEIVKHDTSSKTQSKPTKTAAKSQTSSKSATSKSSKKKK